jgi:glutaredoxin
MSVRLYALEADVGSMRYTSGRAMTRITLYSRVGCHLCDVMKEQIDRYAGRYEFTLDVVDIDQDPKLREEYNWDVPVLVVDGEKIAKYRLDEAMLLRRLDGSRSNRR